MDNFLQISSQHRSFSLTDICDQQPLSYYCCFDYGVSKKDDPDTSPKDIQLYNTQKYHVQKWKKSFCKEFPMTILTALFLELVILIAVLKRFLFGE